MKCVENTEERLVLSAGRSWLYYGLLAACAYGVWMAATAPEEFEGETQRWLAACVFLIFGLGGRWLMYATTVVFDRAEGLVAIRRHRLIGHEALAIPLGDVEGAVVRSTNGKTRRAYLKHKGRETPLTAAYKPGVEAREVAAMVDEWLSRPEDEGPSS